MKFKNIKEVAGVLVFVMIAMGLVAVIVGMTISRGGFVVGFAAFMLAAFFADKAI